MAKAEGNGKTGEKTRNPSWLLPGYDPRRGHGKPGRSGRRPDEWVKFLRELLSHARVRERLEAIMTADPDVDHFLKALKLVEERVHGKAVQPIEPLGKLEVVFREE